jgi:hypothetical protein
MLSITTMSVAGPVMTNLYPGLTDLVRDARGQHGADEEEK